jgi:flagellar assembly protein FliH
MVLSDKVIKADNVHLIAKGSPGYAAAFPDSEAEEAEQARKQAYDQGFAAGAAWQKEQGLTTLKAFSRTLQEVGVLKKKLLSEAEGEMLKLILAVAEKVIYDEVSTNRQIILGVLREAVKGVLDREGMKIRLNPQDYLFMLDMKADFLQEFSGVKNITFEEDGGIQRGGATLETIAGEVDARLEQRVKEVKGALKKR